MINTEVIFYENDHEEYCLQDLLGDCRKGLVVFLWSFIEEIFKWGAALFSALDTKEYNEPIDAVIYLITASLGFAAMENTFFLVSSISNSGFVTSFVSGNLRFIGATLLHVLSSGTIGLLSYCKHWLVKKIYFVFGLALAVLLHAMFNLYIMKSDGTNILIIFLFVWLAIILLLAGFEKIKKINQCR